MRNTVLPRFIENFKLFLDGTKIVKFSSVAIEIAVAGPGNVKRKPCLSLQVHLSGFCLDVTVCANELLAFPWSFKLRVSGAWRH